MAPPALTTLPSVVTGVVPNPPVFLGKNFSVANSATGVNTALPITTSTVITAKGLNINSDGTNSKLTINESGDINSAGALSIAGKLEINNDKFTVSAAGAVAAKGSLSALDLAIGTDNQKFTVSSAGAVVSASSLSAAGDLIIATDKFKVTASTGAVTAAGDLNINSGKFTVAASTGALAATGDLNINSGKFTVAASTGDVTAAGTLAIAKSFAVNTNRFNVTDDGSLSINTNKFMVDSASGSVLAAGDVSVTGDLKINTNKFTVAASSGDVYTVGKITAANNLTINTDSVDKFTVTAATGAVAAKGDLSINTDKFLVTAATGAVAAKGDLSINTDKFFVAASTGAVAAKGDLNINSGKFTVAASGGEVVAAGSLSAASLAIGTSNNKFTVSSAGAVVAAGALSTAGDLAINTNKFTVAASTGNVIAAGSVSAASASVTAAVSAASLAIGTDKTQFTVSAAGAVVAAGSLSATSLAISSSNFTVSSTGAVVAAGAASIAGDLKIATDKFVVSSTDGKATSAIPYNSYILAECATNTTTTSASGAEPAMTSATSAYLTTQEYVDKQLWNQTKRINTILGSDESVVTSFNNVYNLVTKFAGESSTVATLNNITGKYDTLVDRAAEIVTSVSDVVAQAYNTVLVNCTPSVWADECGPVPIPSSVTQKTVEDGWYFKNYVGYNSETLAKSNKINWYVPINGADMTVGDIQNLYMNIFAASNVDFPFITIFTQPKKDANGVLDPNNYATWAGAKITYVYSATSPDSNANKSYCLYTNKSPMNIYGKTPLSPSDVATANKLNRYNGTEGVLSTTSPKSYDSSIVSATDKVLFITVQSKSTSLVNQTEFVLNSLNVCLKTGTTNFAFSNAGVTSNYLFNYFFAKNVDFSAFPAPAKQEQYVDQYNTIVNPAPAV